MHAASTASSGLLRTSMVSSGFIHNFFLLSSIILSSSLSPLFFENIGLVYTCCRGNTRFVELELVFGSDMALSDITAIGQRIKEGLSARFPDLSFRLMPLASSHGSLWFTTG